MNLKVEKVLPYNQNEQKSDQIETMFDNIAHRYDFLNHLLSAGIDITWRKRAIRELAIISPKAYWTWHLVQETLHLRYWP